MSWRGHFKGFGCENQNFLGASPQTPFGALPSCFPILLCKVGFGASCLYLSVYVEIFRENNFSPQSCLSYMKSVSRLSYIRWRSYMKLVSESSRLCLKSYMKSVPWLVFPHLLTLRYCAGMSGWLNVRFDLLVENAPLISEKSLAQYFTNFSILDFSSWWNL